mgnify:CR=1 FL=1
MHVNRSRSLLPRLVTLFAMFWSLGACPGPAEEVEPPHFRVNFDASSLELTLMRDDQTLLSFPTTGLQLGTMPALDDSRSYDPVYLEEAVSWHIVTGAALTSPTDSIDEVSLQFSDGYEALLTLVELLTRRA